eukprot:TRINITY_DN15256_c0_g1::TRINITY_DN15256_c0_g1_i1::g.30853::m.30853 TRINITY_DN15256_c0_g1::TRINITY_DN15256_c0_g1_i1::g.30853  ORF type:complete len:103 (-),score=14.68 TRINITY_DN15256_c0_g1_i1:663-971(-)
MNNLNINHILADRVQELGHGVTLMQQCDIESKTFGCYLDGKGEVRSGYFFKNGSNVRVVTRDKNGNMKKTAVPRGKLVLSFVEERATFNIKTVPPHVIPRMG